MRLAETTLEIDEALNCSRLLTLAFYERSSIGMLLKANPKLWDEYLGRLKTHAKIEIDEKTHPMGGGINLIVKRDGLVVSPSVRMLVEAIFEEKPRAVLEDCFRIQLQERYEIEDNQQFFEYSKTCVETLFGQVGRIFARAELLELLDAIRLAGNLSIGNRWAEGIVELLEWAGTLEPELAEKSMAAPPKLAIVKRTDHSRFLIMAFAKSTGCEGLDGLLFGGYYAPPMKESGLSCLTMAISGPPGIGKSNLAMAFAAAAAARGAAAIYLDDERPTDALRRQVESFYQRFSDSPFKQVDLGRDDFLQARIQPLGKHLYLSGREGLGLPLDELTDAIRRVIKPDQRPREVLIVVDSVSARKNSATDLEWREKLIDSSNLLTERGFSVLFVLERDSRGFAQEDYVVDLSIHLHNTFEPAIAYAQRNLEIVKSRHQFSNRGPHFFSIRAQGAVVYPSSAASITMRRRSEVLRPTGSPQSIALPNIQGFARCAGRNLPPLLDDQDFIPWWQECSLTLVTGPRSSLKQVFAASFAEMPSHDNDCVLSVHFGSELPWLQTHGGRTYTASGSRVGLKYRSSVKESAEITQYLFRTSYFAPGPVMDEIGHFLDAQRRSSRPVRRAIISDLSVLAPHFPFLRQDPLFIPTLCDLLSSHGVTTCIVYTPAEAEEPDPVYEQLSTFVNNVIEFTGPELGSHQMKVTSSATNDHFAGLLNVKRSGASIEVSRSSELTTTAGAPVKVQIYLDGGSKLQQEQNKVIKGALEPNFTVMTRSPAILYNQRPVVMTPAFERNTLNITMVDAYRVPWLSGANPRKANLLEPVWESKTGMAGLADRLCYQGSWSGSTSADEVLYTIPYFLNPSLLVLEREFSRRIREARGAAQRAAGESEPLEFSSWEELIGLAADLGGPSKFTPFSFSKRVGDTLNCFFFEILWSLPGGEGTLKRLCMALGSSHELEEEDLGRLCEAFDILLKLWLGSQQSSGAIFWREWYTNFRDLEHEMLEKGVQVELARLPGHVWTNGDWHLGILAGSNSPWLGTKIIHDQFVSHDNAMNLMTVGVGLSPFRSFYRKGGRLPVSRVAPNWYAGYVNGTNVIYRARLGGYARYGEVLSFHLDLMLKDATGAVLEDKTARDTFFRKRLYGLFDIIAK
jgi:KaiC/GvpD/RAD55 family RecA-like ATPase